MSLRFAQLRHFIYVAKLGSYTLAAKKLLLTTQAVSKSVHDMERQLNVKVFYSKSRTLHLTAEGVEVFRCAQGIVYNMCEMYKIAETKSSNKNKNARKCPFLK